MQTDVGQLLRERFDRPLDECATRRVVFWHDPEGSFGELVSKLETTGLGTARPVSLAQVQEGGVFALKRRIYRQEPDSDFLVYTRSENDLSSNGLEGNWLADLELISEHFQADQASMVAAELDASDSAVAAVRRFAAFFGAASRRSRFKALVPHAQSEADVTLGVIACVLEAREITTEGIIRGFLCASETQRDPLSSLSRYGARDAFARFVERRTGYKGDLATTDDLAAHLLLTALSAQLPQGSLAGLEGHISTPHGQFCLNIVRAWMDCERDAAVLYELARRVERLCELTDRLSSLPLRSLEGADVFPCINECLLTGLFESMASGTDRADDAEELVQCRRDLRWYGRVASRFDALAAAAGAQRFYREHATEGFHATSAAEAWGAYTSSWHHMDGCYRAFCHSVDASQRSVSDVPGELDDALEHLAGRIEDLYVNWFLAESNACWVRCCESSWSQVGYAEGIARQDGFYDERVRSGQGKAKKVLVIISDALRYEVASQLVRRLEGDTAGSATLTSMQAAFPSITEFGMAALLPHHTMSLKATDAGTTVLLDGQPTVTTQQRETVLRHAEPSAICVQSKDLMQARRAERRAMFADATVAYVYHNQIDAIGEGFSTEDRVFDACEDAVDDLVALAKIAMGDLQFSRVLITADHGFLYTRRPLAERDKVSLAEVDGHVLQAGRRYVVCDSVGSDVGPFVRIDMQALGGASHPTLAGLAPRECVRIKKAGPGESYVHGGVSLQELCVPVVELRSHRSGQRGFEEREQARLSILSTNRRVTSMLFSVRLFQDKAVGGKVLPAEYELAMTDSSGNEVSDGRRVHATMEATDDAARTKNVQLALKAGVTYDPKASYYLVCLETATGSIAWKEEYHIDIPFAPLDDFGF